jgi:uncharacterized glyoxalase superfamily protein PhnB
MLPGQKGNKIKWAPFIEVSASYSLSSVFFGSRGASSMIEGLSAITLGTHNMSRAVQFYRALGFNILYGGEEATFTSLSAGSSYLNLIAQPPARQWSWWGRVIFHVSDVDRIYQEALTAGFEPSTAPRDAEWGERFFHLTDPDGHELSFARPLGR